MKKKHTLTIVVAFAVVAVSLIIPIASSVNALECGALPSELCANADKDASTVDETGTWKLLRLIIIVMTAGAGIVAIGGIIYGAVVYVTAGGNQEQVKKARTALTSVVIGVVAFGSMLALLNWLVPGGVLDGSATVKSSPSSSSPSTPDKKETPKATPKPAPTPSPAPDKKVASTACYWAPKQKQPTGKIYHVPDAPAKVPYAFENSPAGVRHAAKNGYAAIDIDLQVTKDGVVVATHTQDPLRKDARWGGFTDPTGKLKVGSKKKISEMTWAEVSRLVHKDGYKIHKIEDIVAQAKKSGIALRFELKQSSAWIKKLPEIAAIVSEAKVTAHIAIQTNKTGWKSTLAYAQRLGFWTRNITAKTWSAPKADASLCKKLEG